MPGFDINPVEAQPAPQQPNAMQTISGLAGLQSQLNQNKLFPLVQQQMQLGIQTGQQGLVAHQIEALQNVAASVPPVAGESQTDRISRVMGRLQAGVGPYTQDQVTQWAANPQNLNDITNIQRQAAIATQNAPAIAAQVGTPTPVSTGAGTQFENVNPYSNTVAPMGGPTGGFVANALSPQELASPVQTVDQSGTQSRHTLGEYVNGDGTPKAGVVPPMTALGPLSANAQGALGAAYGPQIASFEASQGPTAQAKQAADNARQEAAQFTTGPASDQFKRWGELLSEFGVPAPATTGLSETAAREAYGQSIIQVLRGQQASLHMDQTDAARQTAGLDVPGSITTPEGIKIVLGTIEGNYDAQLAMGKAWEAQKAKGGAASWGQFQTEFPNRVPPSIFQAQYNPDQITQEQQGWSAAKKADWQARYDKAKSLGWLPNAQ